MRIQPLFAGVVLAALGLGTNANAAVVIHIGQVGNDVVVTTEPGGSLDLSSLVLFSQTFSEALISPSDPLLVNGDGGPLDIYDGTINITGPFSSDPNTYNATSGTGDTFGFGPNFILVPDNYVSGDPLSGTSIYANTRVGNLGLEKGTYFWRWSSDNATVNVVPVPAAVWLFASGLGLLGWCRGRGRARG